MTDKIALLLLTALRRALAEPSGLPLHGGKSALFPSSNLGKQAAQQCVDEALLQPLDDSRFGLTERGLDWLLQQVSPRTILDDLVRALEARQQESTALVSAARQMQTTLETLRSRVDRVLQEAPTAAPSSAWQEKVVAFLEQRRAAEDCSLPELFNQAQSIAPRLTIGGFHDGLRQLRDDGRLYLHPWTGPLYALPEPPFALLIGHEIAYYASPRQAG